MWAIIRFIFSSALIQSVVARILLSLGIGFVTAVGYSELLQMFIDSVKNYLGGMAGGVVGLLGLSGADYILNGIFSGYSAVIALSAVKKMVLR